MNQKRVREHSRKRTVSAISLSLLCVCLLFVHVCLPFSLLSFHCLCFFLSVLTTHLPERLTVRLREARTTMESPPSVQSTKSRMRRTRKDAQLRKALISDYGSVTSAHSAGPVLTDVKSVTGVCMTTATAIQLFSNVAISIFVQMNMSWYFLRILVLVE